MIHCTKCGTQISDVNLRVYSTYKPVSEGENLAMGLENDSIDVSAMCHECKHKIWIRIHQEDFVDEL